MKKLLFFIIPFFFISCVSTPTMYSDVSWATTLITGNRIECIEAAKNTAVKNHSRYVAYVWNEDTLSFNFSNLVEDLYFYSKSPSNTKYIDIQTNKTDYVPYFEKIKSQSFKDYVITYNDYTIPDCDLTKKYRSVGFFDSLIEYKYTYLDSEENGKWYYPLEKIEYFICNENGVRSLTDFNYNKDNLYNNYNENDFLLEDSFYKCTTCHGNLNETGVLSVDYAIYSALLYAEIKEGYTVPTDFLVVKFSYGVFNTYRVYYMPSGYKGICYVTEVAQCEKKYF